MTWFYAMNYGARAHAFALQKMVQSLGYECEFVNYRSPQIAKMELRTCLSKNFRYMVTQTLKLLRFRLSSDRLYKGKKVLRISKLSMNDYKTIILGSDEIFNLIHPSFDKVYFGVGISPDISLITYAVSCGQMGKTDKYPNEISSNIMRYRHISVRDQWTKEILEPYIIDKNIELVLDPTFLIDFSGKDSGLFSAQHYLLVYAFSEFSPDTILQIKEYANKNDLKIIRIGHHCSWADKCYPFASQNMWYEAFQYADTVVTDSFHGVIFAIKNQKPIVIISKNDKTNKILNLLEMLQITLDFYDGQLTIDDYLRNSVDYCNVFKIIEKLKKKSIQYLRFSLSEK